jgi:hypothetical protein
MCIVGNIAVACDTKLIVILFRRINHIGEGNFPGSFRDSHTVGEGSSFRPNVKACVSDFIYLYWGSSRNVYGAIIFRINTSTRRILIVNLSSRVRASWRSLGLIQFWQLIQLHELRR